MIAWRENEPVGRPVLEIILGNVRMNVPASYVDYA